MIPIPERIHQIIDSTKGTKASFLCARLATEYLGMTSTEIRNVVITMIHSGELVEVEYRLPNLQNESLLLPKGTRIMGYTK